MIGRTHLYFCGKTEAEAKKKRTEAAREIHRQGPRDFDANRLTFGEWLERWMDSLPGVVSDNTRGFYEHRCRAYLIPGLGSVCLNALTAEHLDGLYRDLGRGKGTPSGKPLAPSTPPPAPPSPAPCASASCPSTWPGTPSPRASRRGSAPRWPSPTWRPSSGPRTGSASRRCGSCGA